MDEQTGDRIFVTIGDAASVGAPARGLEDVEGKVQREDEPSENRKLSKTSVDYSNENGGKPCEQCINWLGVSKEVDDAAFDLGTCKVVEGSIWEQGNCDRWVQKNQDRSDSDPDTSDLII
jgi:hypothetical protein